MKKDFENLKDKSNLLIIFFLIIVIGDALTKIFFFPDGLNISKYVKALLLVPLVFLSFKENRTVFIYLTLSFVFFSIGSLSFSLDRWFSNIPQFFEYYFLVLFFIAFKNIKYHKLGSVLEIVFLSHVLIILVATIFEIRYFKTYSYGNRLGYLSFFNSQNEFSYVIMAGMVFFTTRVSKNNLLSIAKAGLMILGGLLVGTKAIVLFLILLVAYFFIFKMSRKFILWVIAVSGAVVIAFGNQIFSFFKVNYGTLYNVYQKEGFLSFLSSKRTFYLEQRLQNNIDDFGFINYFFGSYNLQNIFEMSSLDILFFFGLIGTFFYGYINYRFVLKEIVFNQILILYLVSVFGISLVAGYLIENTSAQIYTLLVILFLSSCIGSNKSSLEIHNAKTNA